MSVKTEVSDRNVFGALKPNNLGYEDKFRLDKQIYWTHLSGSGSLEVNLFVSRNREYCAFSKGNKRSYTGNIMELLLLDVQYLLLGRI